MLTHPGRSRLEIGHKSKLARKVKALEEAAKAGDTKNEWYDAEVRAPHNMDYPPT